jgi:thymidylate synthase (FAD)
MNVLDHGHVRLFESMGSDLSVVRNARVSYDAEWRTGEDAGKDEKLIRYLLKNRHTSPFEAVVFTFDIKCPMFIARQWHRHRTWSYNEVSARYSELPAEFYVPDLEQIGTQSQSHKQARDIKENPYGEFAIEAIRGSAHAAFALYQELLAKSIPREIARSVLPLNTYTHFFGTVDLHNLFHFLELRLHPHAQWEIRQYAAAMLELITPVVPICVAAFKEIRGENEQ